MSITEVPGLPFKAGRHLAAWIVWHTARVSWVEDEAAQIEQERAAKRRKRGKS